MNKKGAASFLTFVLIAAALFGVYYFNVFGVQSLFQGGVPTPTPTTTAGCPSSGLTELSINTQQALAASATPAITDAYIFDKDGNFVTTANSGTDGIQAIDVQCGESYKVLVLNASAGTGGGYYPETFDFAADKATFAKNLKMYLFGNMNLVSIASDVDPLGHSNISGAIGKTCGVVITMTENLSASAFNKPLILCQANSTSVQDVYFNGVTEVTTIPTRFSALQGWKYWAFEYPQMLKSTDSAVKISGKIKFADSGVTIANQIDGMNCSVVDQTSFLKTEYQTLGYSAGFVEAAENLETHADIGAGDSTRDRYLNFVNDGGYC